MSKSEANYPPASPLQGNVYIWRMNQYDNMTTIAAVAVFQAHQDYITRVLLSPDVKHLATCSADHTAKIWNLDPDFGPAIEAQAAARAQAQAQAHAAAAAVAAGVATPRVANPNAAYNAYARARARGSGNGNSNNGGGVPAAVSIGPNGMGTTVMTAGPSGASGQPVPAVQVQAPLSSGMPPPRALRAQQHGGYYGQSADPRASDAFAEAASSKTVTGVTPDPGAIAGSSVPVRVPAAVGGAGVGAGTGDNNDSTTMDPNDPPATTTTTFTSSTGDTDAYADANTTNAAAIAAAATAAANNNHPFPTPAISTLPSDPATGALFLETTLAEHQRWVWDCAFSADSAYLVTVSSDHNARLWELGSGAVIRQYAGHHRGAVCVALNDYSEPR